MLYVPEHFRGRNEECLKLIHDYPFAVVISQKGSDVFLSHVPLLLDESKEKLLGHVAFSNEHWRLMKMDPEVTVVFNGPHTYVTPRWYVSGRDVPTWNYATVHVRGHARVMNSEKELVSVLRKLHSHFEGNSTNPLAFAIPDDLKGPGVLERAIVGFEITMTDICGKFKLNQNRVRADREGVVEGLRSREDEMSHKIQKMMQDTLKP